MKEYLLGLTASLLLVAATGCSKDDDNGDVAIYAGEWSGTFTGDDEGDWFVAIDEDGTVDGVAHSSVYSETSALQGSVKSDGSFSATSIVNGDGNGTFTGRISGNSISGTWTTKDDDGTSYDGTWQGERE